MVKRKAIFLNIFDSVLTQLVDPESTNTEHQRHKTHTLTQDTHTHTHVYNKESKKEGLERLFLTLTKVQS